MCVPWEVLKSQPGVIPITSRLVGVSDFFPKSFVANTWKFKGGRIYLESWYQISHPCSAGPLIKENRAEMLEFWQPGSMDTEEEDGNKITPPDTESFHHLSAPGEDRFLNPRCYTEHFLPLASGKVDNRSVLEIVWQASMGP